MHRLDLQSLPTGIPDDRLKLRVTIDTKFKEGARRSQGMGMCTSQLTPPAKVDVIPDTFLKSQDLLLNLCVYTHLLNDYNSYLGGGGDRITHLATLDPLAF